MFYCLKCGRKHKHKDNKKLKNENKIHSFPYPTLLLPPVLISRDRAKLLLDYWENWVNKNNKIKEIEEEQDKKRYLEEWHEDKNIITLLNNLDYWTSSSSSRQPHLLYNSPIQQFLQNFHDTLRDPKKSIELRQWETLQESKHLVNWEFIKTIIKG